MQLIALLCVALGTTFTADRLRPLVFHSYRTLLIESDQSVEVQAYGKELLEVMSLADKALGSCRVGVPHETFAADQAEASSGIGLLATQLDSLTEKRLLEAHRQIGLLWFELVSNELGPCPGHEPPPPEEEEPPAPGPSTSWSSADVTGHEWVGDLTAGSVTDTDAGVTLRLPALISNWMGNNKANGSFPEKDPAARYGDRLTLTDGHSRNVRYATGSAELTAGRGDAGDWLIVEASNPGQVVVNGRRSADNWYFERGNGLEVRGLHFVGVNGTRALIKTDSGNPPKRYADLRMIDCTIDGLYDATTDANRKHVHWGHHHYHIGATDRGEPYGFILSGPWGIWQGHVGKEHFWYGHNSLAPGILIENVWITDCRRTAVQEVNRFESGGADASALIHIRDCRIRDVCLEDSGGGSALTFKGQKDVLIERVEVRLGARKLAPSRAPNITGAFVAEYQRKACQRVRVLGCDFQVGPVHLGRGDARRPNVKIEAAVEFELGRDDGGKPLRIANAIGSSAALSVTTQHTTKATLDSTSIILGDCVWNGVKYKDRDQDGDGWPDGEGFRSMLEALADDPIVVIR